MVAKNIISRPVSDLLSKVEGLDYLIEKNEIISRLLDNGGFIAGGFPRYVVRQKKVGKDYFTSTPVQGRAHSMGVGDIDVFFPDRHAYLNALSSIDSAQCAKTEKSKAGFALNCEADLKFRHDGTKFNEQDVKIQLINAVFGSPEEIISSFDFVNSMIGFDSKRAYSAIGRPEAERSNTVVLNGDVRHTNLLGWRLHRYIEKYAYDGISPESNDIILDHAIRIACEQDLECENATFNGDSKGQFDRLEKQELVRRMLTVVSNRIATVFLGSVTTRVYSRSENENDYTGMRGMKVVDMAYDELERRRDRLEIARARNVSLKLLKGE